MEKTNFMGRLINPNLGHPRFINLEANKRGKLSIFSKIKNFFSRKRKRHKYEFETALLFGSEIPTIQEFEDYIRVKISLIPILEERKKPRKILFRIRNFFRRKKKLKEEEAFFEKSTKERARAYRGVTIKANIVDIQDKKETNVDSAQYLEDEYCTPQPYFSEDTFDNLGYYYCVKINFFLSKEVIEFLKLRTFVMFDIQYGNSRLNYHSIVVTKQKWKNFNFIQISDLHLAQRNDMIYGIVSKWKRNTSESVFGKVASKIKSFFNIGSNENNTQNAAEKNEDITMRNDNEEENDNDRQDLSLKKRLINPNNQLRKFIKTANKKVQNNKLDFIVLTGDLVDFVVKSTYSPYVDELKNLNYEMSNWKVFKDIVLNLKPETKFKGVIEGEELLSPLFTIVGNHDFRPNCYDFKWGSLYRKIGLKAFEAAALNEVFSTSPITALSKSENALKHYLREINPSLDFSLRLGDINFIFLNSGGDSFKNLRDLVAGHPSVTGLNSDQITYLENLANSRPDQKNTVLFIHGPPINIGKKQYFKKRFKKSSQVKIRKKLEDFKESISKKLGLEKVSPRIDSSYNVKFGTVSKNWDKLINFCLDHTILSLSGHTHLTKEFRLEPSEEKTKVFDAPPFFLRRIEVPAKIFYDIYSEIYTSSKEIKDKGPFVVQTPALGLASYRKPNIVGGYRVVRFRWGDLKSFKVKYMRQNPFKLLNSN